MVTKVKRFAGAHPFVVVACTLLLAGCAAGAYAWNQMFGLTPSVVYFGVPDAPQLTASGPDQTVYRIDATRSTVTYAVDEKLAGSSHTANGSTHGIAGDILIDDADPSASQIGEMVVNVQQLTSDQSLRDERIRRDYLESNDHPLVNFQTTQISGMPDQIVEGTGYDVTITGDLTVKTTTAPVELHATATRQGDELQIQATASLKLSTFDIGPINLAGFVSTGDDAQLTFDLVAVDATKLAKQTQVAMDAPQSATSAGAPSFAHDVEPILEQRCAVCHTPGQSGASTWELATAGDAARVAPGLGLVTKSRYMPPWPASDLSVDFQHNLRLSDDELATIAAWADAGGPLDVDPNTRIEPRSTDVVHPRADQVLKAEAPYQGSTDVENDYRCLVIDPGLTEPKVVTGYEFVPDQVRYVHHALIYKMSASTRDAVDARDAADPGTGYQCYGGVGAGSAGLDPSGHGGGASLVMGWAPGQLPGIYPDGTGLQLQPGDFFVMQIHYHYLGGAPPDQSSLVLQYGDQPPDSYDGVKVTTYLAPAEIPCTPDEVGPLCDRSNALLELAKTYGPAGAFIADGLNVLCGTTPEQLGVLDGTIAHSSCDHKVRSDGQILAVLGHMHELGKSFRMTLNPGTPDEKVLLDIPNWDFDWQLNYAPVDDIELKRGDTIRIECSWDRALVDPSEPPRYVTWAEGTEDEMCFSTITTRER